MFRVFSVISLIAFPSLWEGQGRAYEGLRSFVLKEASSKAPPKLALSFKEAAIELPDGEGYP